MVNPPNLPPNTILYACLTSTPTQFSPSAVDRKAPTLPRTRNHKTPSLSASARGIMILKSDFFLKSADAAKEKAQPDNASNVTHKTIKPRKEEEASEPQMLRRSEVTS
jgi:hypothetical protein